ncbi:hypothetical protein BSB_05200 [Bacillus stercoris]|nr:hypothetical protein C6Y43_05980 [Bacillus subtilis]BEV37447.1 hypothetical protein BSB_05200 [Bacillus stercoris]
MATTIFGRKNSKERVHTLPLYAPTQSAVVATVIQTRQNNFREHEKHLQENAFNKKNAQQFIKLVPVLYLN